MITAQKAFDLGYKTEYHIQLPVRAVVEDFAKRFSLPANLCTAWHLQNKLHGDARLWEVQIPTLTLDAAIDRIQKGKGLGPQRVLTLEMEFTPSLALYVWQSFSKAPCAWGAAQYKDVANVWAIAAQVCSTQGCIATNMANSSRFLPDILDLDPVQTFSADRLLHQNPSESAQPFVMPQVAPVTQNLLLFAQLLTAVAAEGNSMLAIVTVPPSSTSEGEHLHSAIASMLQGLTDGSYCTPVMLTDTADAPKPLSKPSKLVTMLRSAVLITKLVTLTYNVKADLLGHDDGPGVPISAPPISMQTLWYSMAAVTRSLLDTSLAESGAVGVRTLPANARAVLSLQLANQEEQTLCTVLIEHLVVTLRQYLKGPCAKMQSMHQKVACLQLWEVLLPIMDLGQVGPETKRLGALPVVLAFLDHGREEAQAACQVLTRLCIYNLHSGHSSGHFEMLARLQGVRRLSNILCTVPASKAGMKATEGKSSDTHKPAAESEAILLEDVIATTGAAELMIRLLELCPLSPRPLDDDPRQTTEGNGTGQDCPAAASTQAQAVHQPALWPTSKPTDWQHIELVAVKACMSLDWALSLTSVPCIPAETLHKLTALLCHLIQCLVAGHLPDLGMDMQKLFKAGLHPVLTAQVDGHAACSGLAVAMLSRMAVDSSLMSQGSSTARLICSIFCKESAAAQAEENGPPAPSALLIATTRVLHLVAGKVEGSGDQFKAAWRSAMSAFASSSLNQLWLCAGLGAIPFETERAAYSRGDIVMVFGRKQDLVLTVLEQVVQVPTCWNPDVCCATATMLHQCHAILTAQTPTLSLRCAAMQGTLVQLLQQLHMIDDQRLQGLLLTECCVYLQQLLLKPCTGNSSASPATVLHTTPCNKAIVTAITDWIFAWEAADSDWKPQLPDPFALSIRTHTLNSEAMLSELIVTLVSYLDSQQKWHEFAPRALRSVLVHLCESMQKAAELSAQQYQHLLLNQAVTWHFDSLAAASRNQALQPLCLTIDSFKVEQGPAEQKSLVVLWRRAACAAVILLSLRCSEACQHHKKYKGSKQEMLKLRQRKQSPAEGAGSKLDMVQHDAALMLIQTHIDQVVPALRDMQQEPAWPLILANHQPQDWPGPVPSLTDCHQDLVYLTTEKALKTESASAIHSFYSFMLGAHGDGATAAAEQLMAQEAHEAAKAAAKKAKKQKAKARRQQSCLDAVSSSQPTASQPTASQPTSSQSSGPQSLASQVSSGLSLQTQPKASLLESSPSEGRSEDLTPDQAPDSFQPDSRDTAAHETAVSMRPVHIALDEQVSSSDRPAGGIPAASPAAVDASSGADARFLDQLFCCPITKVAMMDPMIAADGHTYERTAIQHWLEGSSLSPVTGEKLPHTRLVPNLLVKSALAQHAQVS